MNKESLLELLRLFLADPEGKIWKDTQLADYLEEARRQYCADSGAFSERFDFIPDDNGDYLFPEDYAGFMIGWNAQGNEVQEASGREIFKRRFESSQRTGAPQFIIDDQSSEGYFKLHPAPADKQSLVHADFDQAFGEVMEGGSGVLLESGYGTTLDVIFYEFAGDAYYCKVAEFEDIADHMALVYYAMSLAYNTDSDMGNAETAAAWLQRYNYRVAALSAIRHTNTGMTRTANYY